MSLRKLIGALTAISVTAYMTLLVSQMVVYLQKAGAREDAGNKEFVIRQFCPQTERLSYSRIEAMGAGLIRQAEVGWLLSPDNLGNAKGHLGHCRPYRKPEDVRRVVLLGDSFTGAIQLDYSLTFAHKLESRLNSAPNDYRVEVINLGIGGYGTDQQYRTLVAEAEKYDPDLVIHLIYLGNDIRDNSRELDKLVMWPAHRPHPKKRYYYLNDSGGLATLEADLDYYYEMNLAEVLNKEPWRIHIGGQELEARFSYSDGQLTGQLWDIGGTRMLETIDRIEVMQDGFLFRMYSDSRECSIDASFVDDTSIAGNYCETGIDWYGYPVDKPEKLTQVAGSSGQAQISLMGRLTRNLVLTDLRNFIRQRLLKQYKIAVLMVNLGVLKESELPPEFRLGFKQGYNIDYRIYQQEYEDPAWDRAWKLTFTLIDRVRSHTEVSLSIPYLAAVIPSMETVYEDYWMMAQNRYPELRRDVAGMDLKKPSSMMEGFLEEQGIPYIGLLDVFEQSRDADGPKLYDEGHAHFNEAGHQVVAEQLHLRILEEKWFD